MTYTDNRPKKIIKNRGPYTRFDFAQKRGRKKRKCSAHPFPALSHPSRFIPRCLWSPPWSNTAPPDQPLGLPDLKRFPCFSEGSQPKGQPPSSPLAVHLNCLSSFSHHHHLNRHALKVTTITMTKFTS